MSDKPNKLSRFWQELKRRRVIHVITVYASASFVLIELINNVSEPLNLPQGLSTIAIVVLAIGFPFAVVLSWIFDVSPKGFEKTKPSSEVPEEERAAAPNSWRIATYVSAVIIIGLISFNLITRTNLSENLTQYGKSIAVLPFINDSQDEENELLINGTMTSILNKLSGINDLLVKQRDAVEQFRDTIVPVSEISEKLGVSYVLRGSMRKYGELVVISVQLIDQKNNTVWAKEYENDIHEVEELYNLESKIAQEVAREIKAIISPEELQRIQKVPTTDPMAVQLCREAYIDLLEAIKSYNYHGEHMKSAHQKYRQALTFDSTYADAITGLGHVYLMRNLNGDRSQETFLDSVKIYIDRSLSCDSEYYFTYLLEGLYYYFLHEWNAAERSYNKTHELNPNEPVAHVYLGHIYNNRGEYVRAITHFEEAEKRNSGELITADFYRVLGHACMKTGFFDLAEDYLRNALVFDGDTGVFYSSMGNLEFARGEFEKSAEYEIKGYQRSQFIGFIGLWNLIFFGQIEEANKYARIMEEKAPWMRPDARGYLAALNGDRQKAKQLFDQSMNEFRKGAKLRPWWRVGHVDAAMICVYRGQKDQAYAYLDELMEIKISIGPSETHFLEINPMFDEIREEERFQKILRKARAGNQAAHEQMRLYLEETGRL